MNASSPEQVLMSYENSKDNPKGGYDKAQGRWYPHRSLEGGSDTIAYGHKLLPGEDFSKGITDEEAVTLLRQDIAKREVAIRKALPTYDSLPQYVKNGIISAWYRGDLGPKATPKTMALMKAGDWSQAATEYLNSRDFKTGFAGVKKRMQDNADAFTKFASEKV
jgi:GH24 family phage-related lysozyme (muramidase)